ncbi:MAG: hypothetical protein ABIK98_07255 [Pseudomonadota bacterium]
MKNQLPACFGRLESVFPKSKDGLRETPENCLVCFRKTECLKTALEGTDGLNVREEFIDRAYKAGAIGFLERWSRKKELRRRRKDRKKNGFGSSPS